MSSSAGRVTSRGMLHKSLWLFSPAVDLCTFLGSALTALSLLWVGHARGWLSSETPEWLWITSILMIDVAHVYATGFRVYFDKMELRRRPWLYALAPLLSFVIGIALHSESPVWFWRILAYLAVFHFIRQQYGWVALYRARAAERDRIGKWIDSLTIYLATMYPLVYWHAHLPRNFWWFLEDDFIHLPVLVAEILQPVYWGVMLLYCCRSVYQAVWFRRCSPGKDVVVVTTAVCWYVGIISFNSDYAFTVTNVIIHGIPYLVLVYWYRWNKTETAGASRHPFRRIGSFFGVIWLLAYVEELLWDTGVWHERPWLFGSAWSLDDWSGLLVPLLAVPQITHYILDGFIWRRNSNERLAGFVNPPSDIPSSPLT
ncbi:MAG: hypothetical protein MK110_16550 [Fuerstiella sp.]|nr:hypothetical protein [Fuerstiella sp.]